MKKSVCFVTVIFPDNVEFFKDFIVSINQQTINDFHLIIFNDGVKDIDRLKILIEVEYSIVDFPEEITIAQNRSFVLAYLKQSKFHYAIFGDSDDYFPSNRVEVN